jgi:aminoglycoside 6'-N-acetyltransferase
MSATEGTLPTLVGEGFAVRPPAPGEAEQLIRSIAADPAASPWWGTQPEVIERWFEEDDVHVLVIAGGEGPVGLVTYTEECDPDYRSAGIDIALLSDSTGRGMGSAALRLLARWLFKVRGHHRLTIDPAVANEQAIRAYERVGFKPIGVARQYERGNDGTWHDNLIMDMLAGELVESERG